MPPPTRLPLHLNFHPASGKKIAAVAAAGHIRQLCSDQFENAPATPAIVVCAAAVSSGVAVMPGNHAGADAAVSAVRATASLFCDDNQYENLC